MSHYDEVLKEARSKATNTAKEYIPKLYDILVDEEHKTAEDARKIIEHDLLEYWSKATVRNYLPQEVKDEQKAEAGKKGRAKQLIEISTSGQVVPTPTRAEEEPESPKGQYSGSSRSEEPEQQVYPSKQAEDEPSPLELAEIKIAQLEDALHKTQQFKPAREIVPLHGVIEETEVFDWLAKRDNKINTFFYDTYALGRFRSAILTQLEGSGVKVFKRLYFEV